ncbi:hypothetical protein [Streptomyces sp. NPDC005281]|uniref:hypothetical protein n=1 Tax=Streptomyces sp. NPDC005281 TaxID=3155712 RepID=UPI0033AD2FAF
MRRLGSGGEHRAAGCSGVLTAEDVRAEQGDEDGDEDREQDNRQRCRALATGARNAVRAADHPPSPYVSVSVRRKQPGAPMARAVEWGNRSFGAGGGLRLR